MARLFSVEVFNQTIGSDRDYYTGDEFYGLLGSADKLLVQIFVKSVSQASTAVAVQYQTSNVQHEWTWADGTETETVTVATIADAPKIGLLQLPYPDDGLGAFGRVKISTTETGVSVRIVGCGRSN